MRKKKKLLLVAPYYYPKFGGLENYVYHIARGLVEKFRWETVVVTSGDDKEIKVEYVDKVKVYRLPTLFKLSNTPINPFWFSEIKEIIKDEKPDLINAHAPVPFMADIAAAASGKIPFILTYHAGSMKKDNLFDPIILFYEKLILPLAVGRAKQVICSSNFIKRTVLKEFKSKTLVLHPGVDLSIFKPRRKAKSDKKTVLFIGNSANMYRLKGLEYLVNAVKKIPGATLKIIGEEVKTQERKLKYLGPKNHKEVAREIQNSDVVVLPSLDDAESFGMVLAEAMACKVPVIGTKTGGIVEIIDDKKDGLLVKPRDSHELEIAIKEVLNNQRLSKSLRENGYKKIQKSLSWNVKVRETNKIFARVLN